MARKSSKTAHVMNLLAGEESESSKSEAAKENLAASLNTDSSETIKELTVLAHQASIQTQEGPLSPSPISIIDMSSNAPDPVSELIRQQLEEGEGITTDTPERALIENETEISSGEKDEIDNSPPVTDNGDDDKGSLVNSDYNEGIDNDLPPVLTASDVKVYTNPTAGVNNSDHESYKSGDSADLDKTILNNIAELSSDEAISNDSMNLGLDNSALNNISGLELDTSVLDNNTEMKSNETASIDNKESELDTSVLSDNNQLDLNGTISDENNELYSDKTLSDNNEVLESDDNISVNNAASESDDNISVNNEVSESNDSISEESEESLPFKAASIEESNSESDDKSASKETSAQNSATSDSKENQKTPAPKAPTYQYLNVMEYVVKSMVDYYVGKFDTCTCGRCIADITALTLTKLPPKYIVVESNSASPLLNFYINRYSQQVIVELTKSCSIVKQNPHH